MSALQSVAWVLDALDGGEDDVLSAKELEIIKRDGVSWEDLTDEAQQRITTKALAELNDAARETRDEARIEAYEDSLS